VGDSWGLGVLEEQQGLGEPVVEGQGISFHLPTRSQKLYKSLKILGSNVPLSGHLEAA
jgi:hypothetical protein